MEDLQNLLEKIQREGLEKANAAAAKIEAEAKEKAKKIVADAEAEAASLRKSAEADAAASVAHAESAIRQGARDVVLKLEASATDLIENLLAKNVDRALADPQTVNDLVVKAINSLGESGPVEVAVGEKLASALKAQLASRPEVQVVLDPTTGSGFSVKLDGGRVEHAFTGEVVAAELARRLRPDLAKLVK